MTSDRADPRLTPGVLAAAVWLMNGERESEASLFMRAYVTGLLRKGRTGGPWHCNGPLLVRLLRRRVLSGELPCHGAVLVGIGEMIAHGHAPEYEIESSLGRLFRRAYPETARQRLFRQALDLVRSKTSATQSSPSPVYESEHLSVMDWSQINFADRWMHHPAPLGSFFGYGLSFIARILLRNAPARLRWFANEANERSLLPAVVGGVGETCFWNDKAPQQALRSGVPLFVGFGVAMLRDGGEDGEGWKASAIDAALIDNKVAIEGRIQVSAFMLKEAVHAWHRQKNRPAENRRRRALLEIDPSQALGGERHAIFQIERLKEEEPELERWRSAVMLALDDALQTAAQQDIDPGKLWSVFEPSLIDTPEIRHRFAMAHADGLLRRAALEAALATFDKFVGVRHPETISGQGFESFRAEQEFAFWAARSQVELSKADGRDPGHDAARRIGKAEAALHAFALQPFAATRFNERFQNSLGRWSLILQFAFLVALSDPGAPSVILLEAALKSASSFLPVANRSGYDHRWADAVAGLVVDAVSTTQGNKARDWIDDERQPALLRTQLVWACPAILETDLQRATSLIDEIAARKTFRADAGRNASDLLNIVDRAAAAMKREDRPDLYDHLAIPYSKAVAQTDAPLAKSVSLQTLLAALKADPDARTILLKDPVWGHSRVSGTLRND
ncbi:hypothetical protein A9174_10960 [Mesorhizobium loti NZP2037]|nr:hypothetical protein A9174_10960 [Mesorhizobium loti NZP2037]